MLVCQTASQIVDLVSQFGLNPREFSIKVKRVTKSKVYFQLRHLREDLTFLGKAIKKSDRSVVIDHMEWMGV